RIIPSHPVDDMTAPVTCNMFDGQPTDLETLTESRRVDLRFGTDSAGELYIFTKSNGTLYKVVDCKDTSTLAMSNE
ncbi:MAG: hypothetical protein AAF223_15600, partial [Bacteroidota bacterium]